MKSLICIGCPMGCMMEVETKDGEVTSVKGNTCKRGEIYAKKELTNPTRIVTTTVRVDKGIKNVVPVKTKTDIPKDKIFACMAEISRAVATAPVQIGDVIIENVAGTGIPVIATGNVDGK